MASAMFPCEECKIYFFSMEVFVRHPCVLQVDTEELIQLSHVEWFIQSVVENITNFSSPIISFALHLTGWLGKTENWFIRYEKTIDNALSTVFRESQFSKDFSTLTAAYGSLSKIADHGKGLKWVLMDLEGVIQQSYSLLNSGSSVFVDRAVISFLATTWTNSLFWCEDGEMFKEFRDNCFSWVCQNIDSAANKEKNFPKMSRLSPVLKLIEEACTRSDGLAHSVVNNSHLYSLLTDLVLTQDMAEGRLVLNILKVCVEKSKLEVPKQSEDLAKDLYMKGCFTRAQELSICLLRKGSKVQHLTSKLQEPIKIAVAKSEEPVTMAVTQSHDSSSSSMLSQMSQTEFQNVVCHSIVCLEKTNIPFCPDVLKLFKLSCDPGDGRQVPRTQRSKLQRVCLNYFYLKIESGELEEPSAKEIISCLIDTMKSISVDHHIYSSSLKCLLPLLPTMLATSCHDNSQPLSEVLSDIIQRHLCSVQWEIRDTTLEFLGQVLEKYKENSYVIDWFISSHLCNHTWQCVTDQDSYVRATALVCMSKMILVQPVWLALISQTGTDENKIVIKVQDILKTDTEAFPRRSAVRFLMSIYSNKFKVRTLSDVTVIRETLMTSSKDFDWEVKLAGLEFVKSLIQQETVDLIDNSEDCVSCYAIDLVKRQKIDNSEAKLDSFLCAICRLELLGCWKALFQAVDDYDQTVCEMADKILLDFSQAFKSVTKESKIYEDKSEIRQVVERQMEKLDDTGICLFKDGNKDSNIDCKKSNDFKLNSHDHELNGHDYGSKNGIDIKNFRNRYGFKTEMLALIDKLMSYETRVKVSGKSDYEANPFSLLDDILSYSRKDEESNVVDCY